MSAFPRGKTVNTEVHVFGNSPTDLELRGCVSTVSLKFCSLLFVIENVTKILIIHHDIHGQTFISMLINLFNLFSMVLITKLRLTPKHTSTGPMLWDHARHFLQHSVKLRPDKP